MRHAAKWTSDCSGKQDFDGSLVEVSTRYWPRGGGFFILDEAEFRNSSEKFPEIKPSAHSSVCLRIITASDYEDLVTLTEAKFEADTEAEVKVLVEAWVQEQCDRVERAVRAVFAVEPPKEAP